MIVALTGAKKNVGDHLIADRAIELLKEFVDPEVINIDRFQKLDDKLNLVNRAKALILCGGPAYAKNIYPGVYPLVDELEKIKVPIIPFGLGWSGSPFGHPELFTFDALSKFLLNKIHSEIEYSSCRDVITESILNKNGYKNVIMTGCPVWYDLPSIGKPFKPVTKIKAIVFTTGAKIKLFKQTLELLKITRKSFPTAKIYVTFHRGILPGRGNTLKHGTIYSFLALVTKLHKVEVRDVSDNLEKIDFYKKCDLHIGYRVHAHLYFLSKRLPSILINEDGRGMGMVKSLELPVLNMNQIDVLEKTIELIENYKKENFESFSNTIQMIENNFEKMKFFLRSI